MNKKIKTTLLICAIGLAFFLPLNKTYAAYFKFLPETITQPNGETINCFASGDEFFNWLHDAEGYTIIQNAENGYYYYGTQDGDNVKPSEYLVNIVDPASVGLTKWTKISATLYYKNVEEYNKYIDKSVKAPHTGTLNNIVVYIRFSDQTEFTTIRQTFDNKFNPETGNSLKSYYKDVSYNLFTVSSSHYPTCALTTNLSYQDANSRNYYRPYNASSNTIGYQTEAEKTLREHTLLKNAVNFIASQVPTGLNIDGDNDGKVDNVCFIIRGSQGAWADLLWAHRWVLHSQTVYINSKRVYDYTFQPETQNDWQTLCHEMFHAIGAPDLYRYVNTSITPVGNWDLMESGSGHMGAYMKWKYSNHEWITDIPMITTSGTYTLNPLSSSTNNCYKIPSPNSSTEFFIVEYRRKITGTFENNVPNSGLLVYRINTSANGNANGPPDEVYIYRPGGTLTVNGSINAASYPANGLTAINNTSNPRCFLANNGNGDLNISNISTAGATISFYVTLTGMLAPVADFMIGGPTTINAGEFVDFYDNSSNNPTSWSWTFNGGSPSNSTAQYPSGITYYNSGSYDVTLIATNPFGSNTITKTNYINVNPVGIKSFTIQKSINIYPNPGKGIFKIDLSTPDEEIITTSVTNLLGTKVFETIYKKNVGRLSSTLDLSNQNKGIYYITIQSNKENITKKIIIQ